MSAEPQKFFIGVIDLFSVLLPGALLTYLFKDAAGPRLFGTRYFKLDGTEGWVVFLFSSYLLGHFIFLVGSWLLDDHVYDPIRKATCREQVTRLIRPEGTLSPRLLRLLAAALIKTGTDQAVRDALRIKEHYLNAIAASPAMNTFQWCKARLSLERPEALATVQRFEADSKFFRSLVIVLLFLVPWAVLTQRYAIAIAGFAMLVLAFWRYVEQRVKATTQAYWYVLVIESCREGGYRYVAEPGVDHPSHAGGVAFQQVGKQVQYLLVQAKNAPQEWVLPKGHIQCDECPQEAAVRELREETGVWGRIDGDLGDVSFTVNGAPVKVRFYAMEALEEGKPTDENRGHTWLPFDKAMGQLLHPESQQLLRLAEAKRSARPLAKTASPAT